ncbi:ATP-dependent helicase/nuclease subunit A [subsurface metagenome]
MRELVLEKESKMEIAESKRLFYVGCTRAEERLIITGGKRSKPDKPDKPSKADQDDLYEKDNWLGWLHTALAIKSDGETTGDTPTHLFRYRRIEESGETCRRAPGEYWKNVLFPDTGSKSVGSEVHSEIKALLQPIEGIPSTGKPEHLSPSGIMDYGNCPALYLYKHVYGLTAVPKPGKSGGFGARYGLFAHRILEKWDMKDGDGIETVIDSMSGPDIPADWKVKLMSEIRHFAGTDICRLAAEADERYCEAPFAFTHDSVIIRGTIDLLFRRGKEWYVVDYKTENVDAEEIDDAAERFRIQLGLYACAVNMAEYTVPESLALFFLTPGITYDLPCAETFLKEIYEDLTAIIDGISRGDYSQVKSELCGNCPYSDMCKT